MDKTHFILPSFGGGRGRLIACLLLCSSLTLQAQTFNAGQQYERLTRGVVAVKTDKGVFLSWRVFGTDDARTLFNVYRDGTLLNTRPLSASNFTDEQGSAEAQYIIKVVKDGKETDATDAVHPWAEPYLTLNVCPPVEDNKIPREQMPFFGDSVQGSQRPRMRDPKNPKRKMPRWQPATHKYSPSDCCVADVDGDGEYELILKWDPHNSHDNAHTGFTDPVFIDCYKIEAPPSPQLPPPSSGEGDYNSPAIGLNNEANQNPLPLRGEAGRGLLWRINLGRNIRAGAHYTQLLAYDFDGDGKAELACKTAPGTIDGKGNFVLMDGDDPNADYVGKEGALKGRIIGGPEYLTVFSGETGEALATAEYKPRYKDIEDWGDNHFNRSERYLACVAYLDGKKPSMVFCRGYYTQSNLAAYDFDGKRLTLRWLHQSLKRGKDSAFGQGAHAVTVGDVDNDGCDEIIYGSATIDHDGKLICSTGLGHGDALHLGDLLPERPGLEVFMVHESRHAKYCAEIHDPATGEILWREDSQLGEDNGRGVAMNCIDGQQGFQWWSLASNNIFTADGNTGKLLGTLKEGSRKPTNFRVYWDGDLLDEPYDGNTIYKPLNVNGVIDFPVLQKLKGSSCNGTKSTPNILADIFGDWREEVVLYDRETCDKLYIHTTTIPTEHRIPTLMHDHVYRMAVTWQNVCYNQPPHLGATLVPPFRGDVDYRRQK